MVNEDHNKINAIIKELNKIPNSNWEDIEGWQALMSVSKASTGYTFNLNTGVIVKGFINHTTGEIKTYHLKKILTEDKNV